MTLLSPTVKSEYTFNCSNLYIKKIATMANKEGMSLSNKINEIFSDYITWYEDQYGEVDYTKTDTSKERKNSAARTNG